MSETSRPADSDPELPAPFSSAAQQAGALRDDHAALPVESNQSLTERQHLADQLWLDALLSQALHPQEKVHREELIDRVVQAIQEEHVRPAPAAPTRRTWLATLASLAAAVILGLLFLSPEAGPKSALAAVERSLAAAAENVDRQYRILMTKPKSRTPLPITLTVRGAAQFVWEQPATLGTVRVGSNGEEYWMVPSLGPVMVAAEGSLIERLLSEKQMSTPMLTLTTALEWLRDRYDLELLPDEELPSAENPNVAVVCEHIRGQLRKTEEILKPQSIDLWCDRSTGVVQRLTAEWPADVKFGPLDVEVRLQPAPRELPADWYEHGRHHAANRVVIRRPRPPGDSPP